MVAILARPSPDRPTANRTRGAIAVPRRPHKTTDRDHGPPPVRRGHKYTADRWYIQRGPGSHIYIFINTYRAIPR